MLRRTILAGSSATLFAGGVAGAIVTGRPRPGRASWYTRIPNVEVVSHHGQRFRFYDDLIRDRIVLINLMYAGCGGICPLVTANLRRVQDLLGLRVGRDLFMYSVTLWPE